MPFSVGGKTFGPGHDDGPGRGPTTKFIVIYAYSHWGMGRYEYDPTGRYGETNLPVFPHMFASYRPSDIGEIVVDRPLRS